MTGSKAEPKNKVTTKVKAKPKVKAKKRIKPKARPFTVGGVTVAVGTRQKLELPAGRLPTGDLLSLPVVAFNGTKPGPAIWLNAALHGDEINGMEIIHRVLQRIDPRKLSGPEELERILNLGKES